MDDELAERVRRLRDTLRHGKELSASTAETLADPAGAKIIGDLQSELELAIEAGRDADVATLASSLETVLGAEQNLRAARVETAKATRIAKQALDDAARHEEG